MAKVDYPTYKIRTAPHSGHVQGLRTGDVVRREYYDASRQVYSLLVVLETGTEQVEGDRVAYFVGALVEGDEPRSGELLDFARVTNLFDAQRGGALYLTASDAGAPYMDVLDGLAGDFSLLWPTMGGGDPYEEDRSRYGRQGAQYLDESYTESEGDVHRIYRLTRTSFEGTDRYGLRMLPVETVQNPERILVSFKVRAGTPLADVPIRFGYTDGSRLDYADTLAAGTEWEYRLAVFTADYPGTYLRSLEIDLTERLTAGSWFEIAELNLVRLADIAAFGRATKGRIGKIQGVADSVFGTLDGYGAYFQNLYAAGRVHVAGTLTAADEQGFGSTFYVGRIHKNCVPNSLHPTFFTKYTAVATGAPTGLGGYCRIPSGTALMEVQSEEWAKAHQGERYCFSFWARSDAPHAVTVGHTRQPEVVVALTRQWQRFCYPFCVERVPGSRLTIAFTKGQGFDFAAPQLEAGSRPTPYQPTDGVLRETDDYGAWFVRGGIGGTIQNPLLRLGDDGSLSSRGDAFVINPDGTGHFASGRFRWTKDTISLRDVTIRWEDLSDEAHQALQPKSVSVSGTDTFHYGDPWVGECDPSEILLVATEQNFEAQTRHWEYLASDGTWRDAGVRTTTLRLLPTFHGWEGREVLTLRYSAAVSGQSYTCTYTVSKQYDGENAYSVYIATDRGTVLHNGAGETLLSAHVMSAGRDITGSIAEGRFLWMRQSDDVQGDEVWNATEHRGKTLRITGGDVARKAVFTCEVTL